MFSWTTVGILTALITGFDVAIDRAMLNRHKGRVHDWLTGYWIRLHDTSLPNLASSTPSATLRALGIEALKVRVGGVYP